MLIRTRLDDHLPAPAAFRVLDGGSIQSQTSPFEVYWANCEEDVREAQRLRYLVFMQEMGARPTAPAGTRPGLDIDRFDAFCDHVLVRIRASPDDAPGALIGTYRVLSPSAARRAGGLYTDTEFDLGPLQSLRAGAVELGRASVDPAWRSGSVIMALWTELGRYMVSHRLDTMIGCASVGLHNGETSVASLWQSLRERYLVAPQWRIQPRVPLPIESKGVPLKSASSVRFPVGTPPLVKGYLRCGVRLLGPPAFDAQFNTADLPMMLRVSDLASRYEKRFLGN
jgi:putative hemolysin